MTDKIKMPEVGMKCRRKSSSSEIYKITKIIDFVHGMGIIFEGCYIVVLDSADIMAKYF